MGWVAIADGDIDAARDAARWMAAARWEHRAELEPARSVDPRGARMAVRRYRGPRQLRAMWTRSPTRHAAVGAGHRSRGRRRSAPRPGPIVLMDVGDNIGGGSSADSTHILAEAQRMGVTAYLQTLYDPEAVEAVRRGGRRRRGHAVGRWQDRRYARPPGRGDRDGPDDRRRSVGGPGRDARRVPVLTTPVRRSALDTTDGTHALLTSKRAGNTSR